MLRRITLLMMLIVLLAEGRELCFSQPADNRSGLVNDIVLDYYKNGKFNGSILVADRNGIIYEAVLGYKDMGKKKKMKQETLIGIASVSKIFTSSAVMQLVNNKTIKLADGIREYLSDLPSFYDKVTIKHLLTHTSGITDCLTAPVYEVYNKDIYAFVKKQKELEFEPGTKYSYNNTAYVLLAMIIEKASGMTYKDYLNTNIFQVCGMDNTVVGRDLSDKKFARSYHASGSVDDRPNYYYGPGEIYTTAADLYKWDKAYFSGKVFEKQVFENILKRNTLDDGTYTNYGLGWGVYQAGDEYLYGHTGGNYGFRSLYEHQKKSGITIIMFPSLENHTTISLQKYTTLMQG